MQLPSPKKNCFACRTDHSSGITFDSLEGDLFICERCILLVLLDSAIALNRRPRLDLETMSELSKWKYPKSE